MARFYVPDPRIEDGKLRITGEEADHIRKVLRLRVGDRITVFNGTSEEYEARIVTEGPSFVLVQVEKTLPPQNESPLEITVAQSLLKREKMDYVIQKATELGVREMIPFVSSRSVPLLDQAATFKRHHRWEKVAIEAAKQCARGLLPRIAALRDYSAVIENAPQESLRLILWEKEGKRVADALKGSEGKTGFFIVIGPEGGFNGDEVGQAQDKGFVPVTLGRRILRAETAGLCLVSILQYEFGDIG
jgi:16S rRNA (uracil1498-N3)-methyltransferase